MPGLENLLAGKTLVKRYRIEEVIGLGGFAAVYRAADERLGREVAVKVITLVPPDPDMRERLRERFEREARAAAALPHHPNVVTVHDFGTDPETGVDFLVMELLKGETAAQLFKREGKPATDVALQILREAAEGIGIGHAAGIIHRDVKPGNVFLAEPHDAEPFRVVVLDFGIARIATDDSELTRTLAGENPLTAAYASPEQIRGDHDLTAAADVFSLGVVGYQLLTGEKPFGAGEGRRLRGRDPVRPIRELNPEVAPAIEAVIAKAMAEDPGERYPDANAFGAALDEAMAEDDRTVIAPAAAAPVVAAVPAEDETIVAPAAVGAAAGAAAAEAQHHPDYVGGPRLGRATAKRGSKAPALVGGLLVLALLAAIAVFAMSRGGGSGTKTAHAKPARDTAMSAGGADTSPSGGPEVLAPPVPGDSTSGAAASTGSTTPAATPSSAAPPSAPAAPPIVRTPGIAPTSPAPAPSPVQAPVVAPPTPAPAPAPAPRPRPSEPRPQPSAPPSSPEPQPQPQPAPQSPPPSPPPAPAPPPPPPSAPPSNPPPPRDTILIPTPTPPPAPPPSAGGGAPPRA